MALTKAPEELLDKDLTSALSITTADNIAQMALVSTDADASDGPILEMFRNSSSPADDDDLGIIKFFGENDASEKIEYGIIEVKAVDVSDGTEDGSINFTAMLNGTARSRLFSNSTETVFNEGSRDLDFRVEGDSEANLFVADASTDRIGIGTNSPTQKLDLRGAIRFGSTIADVADGGRPLIYASDGSGSHTGHALVIQARDGAGSEIDFVTGTTPTTRMSIDSSGNLLVGTTVLTDIASSGTGNEGSFIKSDGSSGFASSNQTLMTLNRKTSDGDIVEFRKDGTAVGSIGTAGGDLTVFSSVSGHCGLRFAGDPAVQPTDNTGAVTDNACDIGVNNQRFKDLYLSGGVFLGGTGSANHLDDYEEGTFDATIIAESGSITVDTSDNLCFYTKIGRLVTVSGRISPSSISNPSGQLYVGNLPFALASAGETSHAGAVACNIYNAATNFGGQVVAEMTTTGSARILIRGNGGTTSAVHTAAANIDSGSLIGFTATYPAS